MKKIFLYITFLVCALNSFAQAPQPRSTPTVTSVDARLRAGLTFGIPITQDTTLNGGLDSLGSLIYTKLYRAVYLRDTNTVGGGHLWTNLSFGATGIKNLNGLTGATQTFAVGTAGTNFNIVSSGTVHTFNIPIASSTNTGLLSSASFITFTNKINISDSAAMLAGYAQNVVLTMPTNTFSSPNVFTGSHVKTGAVTFINQSNNTFLAGPATVGVGAVSWRLMVNADLPISAVTPGTYTNTTVTVNQQGIVTNIANGAALGGQFYDSVTQVNDSTFTLDRPNGTHDTVQIKITVSPAISTLNNGLTLTGTNGQLGGTFLHNTTIFGGGFYMAFNGGRVEFSQGVAVASAANFTVGNDGNLFSVTGNNQINAITNTNWQAGSEIGLIFTGTPLLKNNTIGGAGTSPMLLAGSTDYTAAAGDYIGLRFDGFFWHETTRKLTGAGGVYTFSNGLTETPATRVKLGGTFTQNTTFAGNGFYLAMSGGRFQLGSGIAIASANNLVTGNDGNQFSVTGAVQINAITTTNWQSGAHLELIFTGTPTLKNNTAGGVNTAPMLLAGSVDYVAAAGDLIGFSYDGTVWHETNRKLAGSVSNLTFTNGLTLAGTNVQWGGSLLQNTTITEGAFSPLFTSTGTFGVRVTNTGVIALSVAYNQNGILVSGGAGNGTAVSVNNGIGVAYGATTTGLNGQVVSTNINLAGNIGAIAPNVYPFYTNYTPVSTTEVDSIQLFIKANPSGGFNTIGSSMISGWAIADSSGNGTSSTSMIQQLTKTRAGAGSHTSSFGIALENNGAYVNASSTPQFLLSGNGNLTITGGYISHITTQGAGTYNIANNDWTVIATGTTSTWTFPALVIGQVWNLVNHGSGSITLSAPVTTANGTTSTTITAGSTYQVQYDGTVLRKIN